MTPFSTTVDNDIDLFTLKQVTERVRGELTAISGITQVDSGSAPPYDDPVSAGTTPSADHPNQQ